MSSATLRPSTSTPTQDVSRPLSTAEVDRRWWIGEGSEHCRFCLQGYAIEVETRCFACDEPGCMHCFTTVTLTPGPVMLCGSCAADETSAQQDEGGR